MAKCISFLLATICLLLLVEGNLSAPEGFFSRLFNWNQNQDEGVTTERIKTVTTPRKRLVHYSDEKKKGNQVSVIWSTDSNGGMHPIYYKK